MVAIESQSAFGTALIAVSFLLLLALLPNTAVKPAKLQLKSWL
jgi:hypothetical protein